MNLNDLTITSLDYINGFDFNGVHLFQLSELQTATIANTEEKVDITGKAGRKLNSLKRNKAVTISGTNGMVSGGLMALQTGGEFVKVDAATVMWHDYLVVRENKATTNYIAVGTVGNEIGTVSVNSIDVLNGETFVQNSAVEEGKFTYDPASKTLTFNEGDLEDGTEIVVHYKRTMEAQVLENVSDHYSQKCQLYIDATGEDMCNNLYHIQFYVPRADFSGNFDITLGDNQTVHAFEAESLTGSCGLAGGVLWTYTVVGATAPDVTA